MKIALVTDSTADIPLNLREKHQIDVVPISLQIEGKSYIDGVNLSREEFYNWMPSMKTPASTAAPSVGSFAEHYEKLLSSGAEKIISVHVAVALSGVYNAARLAARNFGERVHVFDSGQLSLGIGFQVIEAADAIAQNLPVAGILQAMTDLQKRLKLFAVLDTLEYLHRSGRVSWAKARIGSLLDLKPIIEMTYSKVVNIGAVRTTRVANKRMRDMLNDVGAIEKLAVLHTNAEARARQFLADVAPNLSSPPLVVNVTPAIGAHLGPNGLGFAAVKK